MKSMLAVGVFCSLSSVPSWAASQTLTGEISDSMCGASHAGVGTMGKNPTECTTGCVKAGGKYVFVSDGKVYGIQKQSFGTLAANAGSKVQVTGDVDKDGKEHHTDENRTFGQVNSNGFFDRMTVLLV